MNNTQCNSTEVFDINQDFYEERCSMDRSSWEYTEPQTFSMVTEVREKNIRAIISPNASRVRYRGNQLGSLGLSLPWILL